MEQNLCGVRLLDRRLRPLSVLVQQTGEVTKVKELIKNVKMLCDQLDGGIAGTQTNFHGMLSLQTFISQIGDESRPSLRIRIHERSSYRSAGRSGSMEPVLSPHDTRLPLRCRAAPFMPTLSANKI